MPVSYTHLKKAYERIAAKYARAEMRLKEDYTKLEETLADAEKILINLSRIHI